MESSPLTSQFTAPSQLDWPRLMSRSLAMSGSMMPREKVMPMMAESMARKAPTTTQP